MWADLIKSLLSEQGVSLPLSLIAADKGEACFYVPYLKHNIATAASKSIVDQSTTVIGRHGQMDETRFSINH